MALGRCTIAVAQRYTEMAQLQMMEPDQTGDWDDAEEQDVRPAVMPSLAHLHLRMDTAHLFRSSFRPRTCFWPTMHVVPKCSQARQQPSLALLYRKCPHMSLDHLRLR